MPRSQAGFGYLLMLFALALFGLALAGLGQVWSTIAQREREAELLFIGNAFSRALGSYFDASPGEKVYPVSLAELVEDKRFPQPVRHLRRLYRDPMTGEADWEVVRAGDRIVAVRSRSEAPARRRELPDYVSVQQRGDPEDVRYSDWVFSVRVRQPAAPGPGAPPGAAPGAVPAPAPTVPADPSPAAVSEPPAPAG